MGEHRWEGYRHPELFELINDGPGPDGSLTSVHRWSELARTLGEIDSGLASAVAAAATGWRGAASDSAQEGLRPLGTFADQARQAAADMRERAEQQAEFIGKARQDMPPPVEVTAEEPGAGRTLLTHLFGGQTDYEEQEAEQDAAQRRAFEVMRTYESATRANTTSLASFAPPPQVVVDTPPPQGAGSPAAQQPITLGWGGATAGATAGAAAGGGTVAGRAAAAGRTPVSGSRGGGQRSPGAERSGGRSHTASARIHSASAQDQPVDREVTEQSGEDGGFFDEPQTSAVPVIGGDSGR